MTESKELITTNTTIDFNDPKMRQVLKSSICPGATDEELFYFAGVCESTGLNPLKKEIWMIVQPGKEWTDRETGQKKHSDRKVQIMTGINGFFAIANNCPEFDGLETEITWDQACTLPVMATARVYRKDRKFPSVAHARWAEFYKPNKYGNKGVWEEKPSIMLLKCAKALALREAFPQRLNGLYAQEEMPSEYAAPAISVEKEDKNAVVLLDTEHEKVALKPSSKAKSPIKNIAEFMQGYSDEEMQTFTKLVDEKTPQAPQAIKAAFESDAVYAPVTPTVESKQVWQYRIPLASSKQLEYLEGEGCTPDESEADLYLAPRKLNSKLDKYLEGVINK